MDLTLLEVHLDGATFTANAPDAASTEPEPAADPTEHGDGGPPIVPFVVGLVGLAAIAYVVRRLRAGRSTDDDLDVTVPDVETATP